VPVLNLNNGITMPALGLGVYQSEPEKTADAVENAIANGYRLIDTAAAYFNEREVGEGIRRSGIALASHGYQRVRTKRAVVLLSRLVSFAPGFLSQQFMHATCEAV
jgi:aryl-alcohol dehydrogenase-like predicted oxidoreductase